MNRIFWTFLFIIIVLYSQYLTNTVILILSQSWLYQLINLYEYSNKSKNVKTGTRFNIDTSKPAANQCVPVKHSPLYNILITPLYNLSIHQISPMRLIAFLDSNVVLRLACKIVKSFKIKYLGKRIRLQFDGIYNYSSFKEQMKEENILFYTFSTNSDITYIEYNSQESSWDTYQWAISRVRSLGLNPNFCTVTCLFADE